MLPALVAVAAVKHPKTFDVIKILAIATSYGLSYHSWFFV